MEFYIFCLALVTLIVISKPLRLIFKRTVLIIKLKNLCRKNNAKLYFTNPLSPFSGIKRKNCDLYIETQYEINYIVPLIGEMLDRFISDHLIYVFLKQDNEFTLVWPKACNDERVFEVLKQLDKDIDYHKIIVYNVIGE